MTEGTKDDMTVKYSGTERVNDKKADTLVSVSMYKLLGRDRGKSLFRLKNRLC